VYCRQNKLDGTTLEAYCGVDAGAIIDLSMCFLTMRPGLTNVEPRHGHRQFQWPVELLDIVATTR
jgi:hypothetical protein